VQGWTVFFDKPDVEKIAGGDVFGRRQLQPEMGKRQDEKMDTLIFSKTENLHFEGETQTRKKSKSGCTRCHNRILKWWFVAA
jgi:hypothetical protein